MSQLAYHEQKDIENIKKLRFLIKELPPFCVDFFRGIEPRTSSRTRIAYAYDLHVFFDFLTLENPVFRNLDRTSIRLDLMEQLTVNDLEEYMEFLKYRFNGKNQEVINKERGIMRKVSSLKSFYNYFYRNEKIQNNPASLIQMPKLHEKEIIRLDVDEVALLLDEVEMGENLTDKQKSFHNKTKIRDLALLTLLLGTGIRVSECVGLDIEDVDLKNGGIHIHRKGGKEVTVYFGIEVEDALQDYLDERFGIDAMPGSERALFLSLQRKRIHVRSVENLVKKYAKIVTPLKKITPHKLRSTYGTNLYRETGDIYLVADVLGHSDVNTTKKHYAALEDERRRSARNAVRLREK
ncbi:MAG: tyrosine-type recombinase/integrase [Lachnospiraceae bacterium]|nr:tyrosine-type recombinase/integrase [Lachnospiraceae bacterium]MCI9281961.1 tyrosine-type recombinase/integrase [Lachnospiraceae bacterium]